MEARVVRADGGRLKLEWGILRAREGRIVEDFLWWEDDQLLGFLGLYAVKPPTVEIAGMVAPPHAVAGSRPRSSTPHSRFAASADTSRRCS